MNDEMKRLRIAIADDEPCMRLYLGAVLKELGHEIVVTAADGSELIAGCRVQNPDLIVTDIFMPGLDGLAAVAELCREQPTAVMIISGHHQPELIERALNERVLAYLTKPVQEADLQTAVALAVRRFREFSALERHTDDLAETLRQRKLLERAKGLLMQQCGLSAEAALSRMRRLADAKGLDISEVAEMIIKGEESFRVPYV